MADPTPASSHPPPSVAELAARLEREIEGTADRSRKALLLYELGELLEMRAADEARAVKSYVAAVNADPALRPPLWNLYRVFTARRSFKNLAKIVDAEVRAAPEGAERAVALTTRAELAEDRLEDAAAARELYQQALREDPRCQPALMALERAAAKDGDTGKLQEILEALLEARSHPALKALHAAEIAELQEVLPGSDVERTAELWRRARAIGAARWQVLQRAERFAARSDRPEDLADVLEEQARIAQALSRGEAVEDAESLPFSGGEAATRAAAALLRRASRVRERDCKDAKAALVLLEQALALAPSDELLRGDRLRLAEKTGDAALFARCIDAAIESAAPAERVAVLVRAAEAARRRGDRDGERAHLVRAFAEAPGSTAAGALLEAHLLSQRDADGLVERFSAMAASAKEPAERARLLLAAADAAAGWGKDLARADALCRKALAECPGDHTVLRARALFLEQLSLWPERADCLEALLAAAQTDDERLDVARELAFVRAHRTRDAAGATRACDRALEIDPSSRWALWMLADLCADAGEHGRRAEAHEKLAALAASEEERIFQLTAAAHARSLAGDHRTAHEDLRRAAERRPDPLVEALIAERLRAMAATDELVVENRRRAEVVLKEGGDGAEERALRLLGRAGVLAKEPAVQAEIHQRITEIAPDDEGGWYGLVRALGALGDGPRLVRALEARAERQSGTARATTLFALAERHEAAGLWAEAARAHRDALEADATLADGVPGRIASAGAAGDRAELAAVLAAAQSSASPDFARALDEELLVLDGLDRAGAAERLWSANGGSTDSPVAILFSAWRSGQRGDVGARLTAMSSFARVCEGSEAHATALGLLACASRAAQSDDLLQSSSRALVTERPDARALGITVADGLSPGLDESLRANALGVRVEMASPARRPEVEIERAEALEQAGRDTEAFGAYQRVLEVYPDDLAGLEGLRRTARRAGAFAELADVAQRQAKVVGAVDPFAAAPMWEEAGLVLEDRLDDRKHAESCYRAALEGDVERDSAYQRLHEILLSRGAKRELAAYVRKRSEVVMEPEVLTALFWEHAELLRGLGDREGALAALENLLLLAEDHVPALALRATLLTELGQRRIPEAVEALGALADAEPDLAEKRGARFRAAELCEKGLRDHEGAVAQLWRLHDEGFGDLETTERIAAIATRGSLDEHLARALGRLAVERPDVPGRAAAERTAAEVLGRGGDPAGASAALGRLLSLVPDDMTALETLCEMSVDPADRATALTQAEGALRARFGADPTDAGTLHALAQVFALGGQNDARFLACSVLGALGAANEKEAHDAAALRDRLPRRPSAALAEATIAHLVHPDDRGAARTLFQVISEVLPEHYGLEPSAFGVGKGQRISPKGVSPLRDEVAIWTGAISLGAIELYQGGPEPDGVVPLPATPPVLILGTSLSPPLSPAALFHVGRAALRLRRGTSAMHGRSGDEVGALLFAAVRSVMPQAPAPPLLRLAEMQSSLPSSLTRKVKKALPEPAQAFASGPDHAEWTLAERHSANRAGALFARDPAAALRVLGVDGEGRRSPEVVELVRFVLSPPFLALRREAGLGID